MTDKEYVEFVQLIRSCNLAQVGAQLKRAARLNPVFVEQLRNFYIAAARRKK